MKQSFIPLAILFFGEGLLRASLGLSNVHSAEESAQMAGQRDQESSQKFES